MSTDRYTVSHDELDRLRKQVGVVHSQKIVDAHTTELLAAIERLHDQLSRLTAIFETANRDLAERADTDIRAQAAKIDRLLDQNEKIARAVVQLSQLVQPRDAKPSARIDAPARDENYTHTEPRYEAVSTPKAAEPMLPLLRDIPLPTRAEEMPQSAPPMPDLLSQTLDTPRVSAAPPVAPVWNPPAPALAPTPVQPSMPPPERMTAPTQKTAPLTLPPLPTFTAPPAPTPAPSTYPAPRPSMAADLPPPPLRTVPAAPAPQAPAELPSLRPLPPVPNRLQTNDSFMAAPVANLQPRLSGDSSLGLPPPPPPPPAKRGILNRFSFS